VNFAPGKIPLRGKSPGKCIYSVPAQEMAKHCAKFGWLPLSDVAAVTKPRRETHLKFAGVPQTPEPISAVSGPKFAILWRHVEDIGLLLSNKFFPIADTCRSCEVVRWCPDGDFFGDFLRPVF